MLRQVGKVVTLIVDSVLRTAKTVSSVVDKATVRFDAVSERLPGDSVWALRISRSDTFGPDTLDEDAVIATLEAQGELLGSEQRPWSVVLQIHQGQPMTVIEPVPLTDVFGIDAKRSSFRNGQWE